MDTDEPIIRITDEAYNSFPVWFENFMTTPIESQLLDPKTSNELLFQSLIFSMASSLKNTLKGMITSFTNESEFTSLLENSKVLIPELAITPDLNTKVETSFRSEDSIFELAPEAKNEIISDNIESDVFRRVDHIFSLNSTSEQDLFNSLDINHDGKITVLEFWAGLKHFDSKFLFEEAAEVFKVLDGDKDGVFYLDDLKKRMKFIEQKAFDEIHNPLSCAIFPEPLNPDLTHGALKVTVGKVSGLKGGPRSLKFRLKSHLEYISHDFTDNHFPLGFKCEFPFENQTSSGLPSVLEVELLNKNVVEGSGSFNWSKNHQVSSDFTYKHKVDLKTSLGQAKGTVNLLVNWSLTQVQVYNDEDKEKIRELKEKAKKFRESMEDDGKKSRPISQRFTDKLPGFEESDDYLVQASSDAKGFVKDQSFIVHISQTKYENARTQKSQRTLLNKSFDGRSPCKVEFFKTNSLLDMSKLSDNRPKTPTSYSTIFDRSPLMKTRKEAGKLNRSFAL